MGWGSLFEGSFSLYRTKIYDNTYDQYWGDLSEVSSAYLLPFIQPSSFRMYNCAIYDNISANGFLRGEGEIYNSIIKNNIIGLGFFITNNPGEIWFYNSILIDNSCENLLGNDYPCQPIAINANYSVVDVDNITGVNNITDDIIES